MPLGFHGRGWVSVRERLSSVSPTSPRGDLKIAAAVMVLILLALIAGCSGGADTITVGSGSNEVPETSPLQTTPPSEPQIVKLRLMTYNVLWGGGVDREFDSVIAPRYQVDRLNDILNVVRDANPDVLAVQEAAGWDRGSPSVAQKVATALGMNFAIAKDDVDLNVVLFSKYPIENVQYAARRGGFYDGFNGVLLMAQLVLEGSLRLNVYAPHLNSQSSAVRTCQTEALLRLANAYQTTPSIILGDMNSRPTSTQGEALRAAGWQFAAAESTWTVDQIWIGPGVDFTNNGLLNTSAATRDLSDHLPVGVEVTLAVSPSKPAGRTTATSIQVHESCPPPQ